MNKITFYLLMFVFLLTHASYSNYSTDKIPDDFLRMLESPASVTKTTNLATFIARQFVTKEETDLSFFSEPQTWRAKWNQKYQELNGSSPARIKGQDIFLTMGTILRGLLNSENKDYLPLANKIAEGMLNALMGDLGFRASPLTPTERVDTIREVLNLGRWMENVLLEKVNFLGLVYGHLSDKPKVRTHFQKCALYLLAGSSSEIKESEWYLAGVSDKRDVIQKVKKYASDLLPPYYDDALPPFPAFDPVTTPITAIKHDGGEQAFFGTPDVKASPLHFNRVKRYAYYPNTMVVGSLKQPNQLRDDTFSITIQLDPYHYFVIMAPPLNKDIALLPAYMMESVGDGKEEVAGNINVEILSSHGGVRLQNNKVHWSTNPKNNTGRLSIDSPLIVDDEETYSFIASVKRPNFRKKIFYYYWLPTSIQMSQLKGFTRMNSIFTFDQFYNELQRKNATDYQIPAEILREFEALKDGKLAHFSSTLIAAK